MIGHLTQLLHCHHDGELEQLLRVDDDLVMADFLRQAVVARLLVQRHIASSLHRGRWRRPGASTLAFLLRATVGLKTDHGSHYDGDKDNGGQGDGDDPPPGFTSSVEPRLLSLGGLLVERGHRSVDTLVLCAASFYELSVILMLMS